MIYHIFALAAGFVLDLIFGDPQGAPHPIRLIGKLIGHLEGKWNNGSDKERLKRGRLLVFVVLIITAVATAAAVIIPYLINVYFGAAVEAVLTYYILAARSLYDESMKVYRRLASGDTDGARKAVSMIVGRDTAALDETGIAKAAIETVAENASDGVIAPMLYTALGGPILGMLYKAVNTMDSMVGYKNGRYLYFGRAAAKTDDVFNFVPSRISACLMMAACAFLGRDYSVRGAYEIHKRDSRKHSSPNAAQTESVCAGALGIRLAGDASYFGKIVKKPYIGDASRPIEYEDIKRANKLMLSAAVLCETAILIILSVVVFCG